LGLSLAKRNSDAPLIRFLPVERDAVDAVQNSHARSSASLPSGPLLCVFQTSQDLGISAKDILLGGFAALLGRLTRQDRFAIRVGIHEHAFFDLDTDCSFRQIVSQGATRKATDKIPLEDQSISYEFLSEEVGAQLLHDIRGLRLTIRERGEQLELELATATGLWPEKTLSRWIDYLINLVDAACHNCDLPISRLPLWTETEAENFYLALNDTQAQFSGPDTVHEHFAEQANRTPEAIAVRAGTKSFTYRELQERSNELARHLIAVGAGPGRAVAVCMERSVDLLAALLAVLQSGAHYIPLDPRNPAKRILTILEESQPAAILCDTSVAETVIRTLKLRTAPLLFADQTIPRTASLPSLPSHYQPDSLAYTIYTSGTTGKPKGVRVTHGSLMNFIHAMQNEPGIRKSTRALGVAPVSFDIAGLDMFLPLSVGATLIMATRDEALDPFRLARLIKEHDVTLMQATPATWRMLVTTGWQGKRNLKMICGGEALPLELANDLLQLGGELWNCYGPTETTIWSGVVRLKPDSPLVPIGPPIANTSFYVMDEAGRPLPPGVPGELYIGGAGVSPGYLNRPELTAQRFVPDTFSDSADSFLFRTGDLVRLIDGNNLEFFGRLDHQIKLRGFRIELGEIESILRAYPAVVDAVTILREDLPGEPRLVAYVTGPSHDSLDLEALKKHAAAFLPEYMLPSEIVRLERLPLSSSGKIDRRALPAPESLVGNAPEDAPLAAAAADELESKLLLIFRDVLKNEQIGVTDSFFRFGGYSLLTVRLFSRIDRDLRVRLPISLLFDAPTVRELADVIRHGVVPSIIVPIRPAGRTAPLFVIHSYLLYGAMMDIVEIDRPLYGVREMGDSRDGRTLEERARRYADEILQTYSTGPLLLAGWCAAGTLTVEIARQLRASGHQVGLVALFDAERPGYVSAEGRGNWFTRAARRLAFHTKRLSHISMGARAHYIGEAMARNWEWVVESWFTAKYRNALWMQRKFGIAVSEATLNTVYARLSDLQDSSDRTYPGKVDLFRAADVPDVFGPDETLGWEAVAEQGVEVTFVPGDHESMFKQPNVRTLAQRMQRILRENDTSAIPA
jgi:amino acid adenylation domain-containing protein